MDNTHFSENYLKWAQDCNLPPLTGNQQEFAEWLLNEDNLKEIVKIGDFEKVFSSIRNWAKKEMKDKINR